VFQHKLDEFPLLTIIASKYFTKVGTMHPDDFSNWVKIKNALEASGNTENFYYTRACEIVKGRPDPIDIKMGQPISDGTQDD